MTKQEFELNCVLLNIRWEYEIDTKRNVHIYNISDPVKQIIFMSATCKIDDIFELYTLQTVSQPKIKLLGLSNLFKMMIKRIKQYKKDSQDINSWIITGG